MAHLIIEKYRFTFISVSEGHILTNHTYIDIFIHTIQTKSTTIKSLLNEFVGQFILS